MMNRRGSQNAFEKACQLIPGGVNSPARAFGGVGGKPIFIAKGEGPFLIDIDGNRYIDYVGSWGPLILGHCHPRVVKAVGQVLQYGATFGAPTELESALAEVIILCVPSIEMVRMVSSGTEASMSAIRLARGFTGRDVIVKFAGCYHGHVDSLLVQAGSSATTLGVPNSPGVPPGCTADTLVLRFNDVDALAEAFRTHGTRIAGVILEPVVGNMGCVPPMPGYLEAMREITARHGALLIFDEVMTGFRVAFGVPGNTRGGWVSLAEARALGYEPRDDAEAYAAEVIAAHGEPDPADPVLAYLGGELTLPGPAGVRPGSAGPA